MLSGGCWQNRILRERFSELLKKHDFVVLINRQVPVNDGGISLGLAFVDSAAADETVSFLKAAKKCPGVAVIGKVTSSSSGEVLLKTLSGGQRILDMPAGELLPRIC